MVRSGGVALGCWCLFVFVVVIGCLLFFWVVAKGKKQHCVYIYINIFCLLVKINLPNVCGLKHFDTFFPIHCILPNSVH